MLIKDVVDVSPPVCIELRTGGVEVAEVHKAKDDEARLAICLKIN